MFKRAAIFVERAGRLKKQIATNCSALLARRFSSLYVDGYDGSRYIRSLWHLHNVPAKHFPRPDRWKALSGSSATVKSCLTVDLAALYGVRPIALRQQVKRNAERFPADFMFQLTAEEAETFYKCHSHRPRTGTAIAQRPRYAGRF